MPGLTKLNHTEGKELVVLVHGLSSHPIWMRYLESRLRHRGYATINWGYFSLAGSLERHASRLREDLEKVATQAEQVHFVAHSMGSIIVRMVLSEDPPTRLGRVVLIAPPNRGTPLASLFGPLVRFICPAINQLSGRAGSFVNGLGPLPAPVGIVGARFDLLVPNSRTSLEGQADHIVLNATHNSLLLQPNTARHVETFLATGQFEHQNPSEQPSKRLA